MLLGTSRVALQGTCAYSCHTRWLDLSVSEVQHGKVAELRMHARARAARYANSEYTDTGKTRSSKTVPRAGMYVH